MEPPIGVAPSINLTFKLLKRAINVLKDHTRIWYQSVRAGNSLSTVVRRRGSLFSNFLTVVHRGGVTLLFTVVYRMHFSFCGTPNFAADSP
jgi:hypothetical protein